MATFEIRSFEVDRKRSLYLMQMPGGTKVTRGVDAPTTLATFPLDGTTWSRIEERVTRLVGAHDGFDAPTPVGEEAAIRLALLFRAVENLRSKERTDALVDAALAMDVGRASSWLAMIVEDGTGNAVPAFRVYVTGDK